MPALARGIGILFAAGLAVSAQQTGSRREPHLFLKEQMGLTGGQIATIASGRPVVKVLPSKTPAEIILFGAVFVNAAPEEYVRFATDVGRLRRLPGYLGAGRFTDPPTLSDLAGFTLEPEDIADLKSCTPGDCDLQLPADAMRDLQKALDWSRPDVASQVNVRVRAMALELLRRYREKGNSAIGNYHDKDRPFDGNTQLHALLERSEVLPVYLPELNRYLLDYPSAVPENVPSLFYWEKVNFGLKPTLRLNHAIAYRSTGQWGAAQVVAIKQLYASHYFQLALDLTACVPDTGSTGRKGFYLISLKSSIQDGLTGFRGSFLRSAVVSKTRAAQERSLIGIRNALEEAKRTP